MSNNTDAKIFENKIISFRRDKVFCVTEIPEMVKRYKIYFSDKNQNHQINFKHLNSTNIKNDVYQNNIADRIRNANNNIENNTSNLNNIPRNSLNNQVRKLNRKFLFFQINLDKRGSFGRDATNDEINEEEEIIKVNNDKEYKTNEEIVKDSDKKKFMFLKRPSRRM